MVAIGDKLGSCNLLPRSNKSFPGQYPKARSCHPNPNDESSYSGHKLWDLNPRLGDKHPKELSLQSTAVGIAGGYDIFFGLKAFLKYQPSYTYLLVENRTLSALLGPKRSPRISVSGLASLLTWMSPAQSRGKLGGWLRLTGRPLGHRSGSELADYQV